MKKNNDLLDRIKILEETIETKNIVVRESLMIMKALVFKLGGSVVLKPEFLEAAKDTDDFVELKYDENGFLRLRIKETDTLN